MDYSKILNSGDPDAAHEYFWYNFKDSVINISVLNHTLFTKIVEDIDKVSKELNYFKNQKRFNTIIIEIENFLSQFLWTSLNLFDTANAEYHLNIANTNIKRWSALLNTGHSNPFKVLKLIYSILTLTFKKHTDTDSLNLKSLVKDIINEDFVFDRERILRLIVLHAYNLRSVAMFNKLTMIKEDQITTISILQSMNVNLPKHIKDGLKIVEQINSLKNNS